jgi:hypothetical protein
MRCYTRPHRFYCGVDLHARTLSLCLLDQAGHTVLEKTIPDGPRQRSQESPYSFQEALYSTSRCTDGTLTFAVVMVLFPGRP